MDRWVDPDEADPAQWRGTGPYDDLRRGAETVSVLERASQTPLPYQYEIESHHTAGVAEQFRSGEYQHARIVYNSGVDTKRRIKLLARGVLWGGDETHERFQAQYRRPPPPTESVPFGEYTVWTRRQYGTIERTGDGLTFTASEASPDESLRDRDWATLSDPVRERLAELELVRNPAFARYRLSELEEWTAYRTRFQYDPDVFALGP
jgi:hypothetical protein